MKIVSLFDGISCGMVALERAGINVEEYHAFEIEQNAITVSKKNYPQIKHHGNVYENDFKKFVGFDLLIGGSPCQSLSITQSKKRKHLDGKSKLFFEYVRAKKTVNPRYFLFENVASMNVESKRIISELLGCEPILIDSNCFSAQDRPRLYWTNIPNIKTNLKANPTVLKDILEKEVEEKYFYNQKISGIDMKKKVCATLDINGHDILKRVNNPNFKCQTLTTCGGGNTQKKVIDGVRARKLTPVEYERLQTLPDGYTEGIATTNRYTAIGNGWTADVIAYIFSFLPNAI